MRQHAEWQRTITVANRLAKPAMSNPVQLMLTGKGRADLPPQLPNGATDEQIRDAWDRHMNGERDDG